MTSGPQLTCRRWGKRCAIVSLAMATVAAQGYQLPDEPRWLILRPTESYLSLDAEAQRESIGSSKGGDSSTVQRLYLAPILGIGVDGSVYHPDLLTFSLKPEFQYVWQQTTSPGGGSSQATSWLPGGNGTFTFLQTKPYATQFSLSGSHDIHQYDFFHSAVEDLETWGVTSGYREGPVPVTVSFQQSHQDSEGLSQHSIFDTSTLNLHAHNDRANNNLTDLSYLYGQFDRTTQSGGQSFNDTSGYHYLTLNDQENFSKSTLNSTLLFDQLDSDNGGSQDLNAALNLSVTHTENLQSLYDYTFTRYSDDFSDAYDNYFRAGVQHQLYESLTSTLDVHGADSRSSAEGSELDADTIGTLETENYTKHLGTWGRITVGNSANYDFTEQHTIGTEIFIAREAHTVTSASAFFRLKVPRNTGIASITGDAAHAFQPLVQGVDYTVDTTVDPWQVTIQFASLTVQGLQSANGSVKVLVSYSAIPNPTGTYSSLSDQFQVRLDLFNQLLSFYSRLDIIRNHADITGFVLQDLTQLQSGVDFTWHGLYANANYTDQHSTFYDYHTASLSEGYSFRLPGNAGMGIDLHQQWSTATPNQHITYEDFLAHFDWQPTSHLNWKIEGGIQRQRGGGTDQDLAIARTHLEWTQGKIRIHLGYEYQNQDLSGETRESHFIYLRARRYFW
jgi:hypothetical protein